MMDSVYLVAVFAFIAICGWSIFMATGFNKYWHLFVCFLIVVQLGYSVHYVYKYYCLIEENSYLEARNKFFTESLLEQTRYNWVNQDDTECDSCDMQTYSFPDKIEKDLDTWEVKERA